jgi:hypothetical protein
MIWQQIHLFFRRLVHNQIYYLVLIIGLTVGLGAVVLAFASKAAKANPIHAIRGE